MIEFHEVYPTGDWRDEIELDEFDIADGITREEIIENLEINHAAGNCDAMLCPVCQFEWMRRHKIEEN